MTGKLLRYSNSIVIDFTDKNLEEGAFSSSSYEIDKVTGVLTFKCLLYKFAYSGTIEVDYKDLAPELVREEYLYNVKTVFSKTKTLVKKGKVMLKSQEPLTIKTTNYIIYE